ncbi:UMP-CMP kinase [Salix suchowensis]|nr:UMP-CMP kinase [Salix suchowensis]
MPAFIDKIASALHLKNDGNSKTSETAVAPAARSPVFDASKVTVIFVLGGPGAGKGTQCAYLVKDFGFCHLSGSEYGDLIRTCIKEGTIVPMEVTVKLLENAMLAALKESHEGEGWADGHGRFLIDGFPRKMDQAAKFDNEVCSSSLVLFFTTTEEVMLERLLERGKTSGREDDNAESIKKRFQTYKNETMPVIEHYQALGKVAEIDSSPTIDEVHAKANEVIGEILTRKAQPSATEVQAQV